MFTQGWTKVTKFIVPFALAALLSGCQSVGSGSPHPFTTMFQHHHSDAISPTAIPEPDFAESPDCAVEMTAYNPATATF